MAVIPITDVRIALDKQMPKLCESDYLLGVRRCGRCRGVIERCERYCWNCGQKIDWGERNR